VKRILITLGAAFGLLVLGVLILPLCVNLDSYKPRLEHTASDLLGMGVRIGGHLGFGLFPAFHVTAQEALLLDAQGDTVASTQRTRLWIELLPLLRKEFRVSRIELVQPVVSIERGLEGRLNFESLKTAALLGALDGARVSLVHGMLRYADKKSGAGFEAHDLELGVSRMHLPDRKSVQPSKGLSLEAAIGCKEIRTKNVTVSDLKATLHGRDGVFELEPITMRLFGGQASGNLLANFTGPLPLLRIHFALPGFRIEEFLKILSPQRAVEGAMDFSASLSMQGQTASQLVQTTDGEISLRAASLTLVGHDLDRELARFESSQSFNLVDVGAVFLAGPFGLAVTKGYNFASLFEGSGGSSNITRLVSEWQVDRGVAHAKDVAMATTKNRIALQGGLDFANQRFADVTVAVIDPGGCATVRQSIHGTFASPTVEKPDVLRSLASPVVKLFHQTRNLFPNRPCEVFYSGSVAPPS
jgi:AsmA protein